jgi:hypothetical protein
MAQKHLRHVRRCAERLEEARSDLAYAILAAAKSGESIRDIVPFAGVSRSKVHDLLIEAQEFERRRERDRQD